MSDDANPGCPEWLRPRAVIADAFRAVSIVLRARASQRDQRQLSLAE